MSSTHGSGNVQPILDIEEHIGTANAKRVGILGQTQGGSYLAALVLQLSGGNPLGVAVVSGSTGSPITVGRNPGLLLQPTTVTNAYSAAYTASVATQMAAHLYNTGTSTRTVTLGVKPSGGSVSDVMTVQLQANEYADVEDIELNGGAMLQWKQDSGSDVQITIMGEALS